MLRGVAAFLVVAEHTRAFLFVPYGHLASVGTLWKAFYAATSLGHQAVLIFFALSGFLIGGKTLKDFCSGAWSWPKYALRRMTRLWIVVLPALMLTFLLDRVGMSFGYAEGYAGLSGGIYASLQGKGIQVDHSLDVFFGNALFLQTIATPVYGSNGPLWSLAYEFWYYVLAPIVMTIVFFYRNIMVLAANAILLALIIWTLPTALAAGGLIWIAGAIAGAATPPLSKYITPFAWPLTLLGLAAILATMMIAEANVIPHSDLLLGSVVAIVLPVLALTPAPWRLYRNMARGLAEISYTLYVTHFPFLMAATMIFFAPIRLLPGVAALVPYALLTTGTLISAVVLWACFERHTDRIYSALAIRLSLVERIPH